MLTPHLLTLSAILSAHLTLAAPASFPKRQLSNRQVSGDPNNPVIDTTSVAGSQGTSGEEGGVAENVGGMYENVATTAVVNPVEETSKKLKLKRDDTNGDGVDDVPNYVQEGDPNNPIIDTTSVAGSQGTSGEEGGIAENVAGMYENVATTAVVNPVEETSKKLKLKRDDTNGDGVDDVPNYVQEGDPNNPIIDTTSVAGSQGTSGEEGGIAENVAGMYENVATTAVVNPVEETSKKLKLKRQDSNGDVTLDTTSVAGSQGTSGEEGGVAENVGGMYENVATTAVVNPVEETSKKLKLKTKAKREDADGDGIEDLPPLKDGLPLDATTSVDSPRQGHDTMGIEIEDGQTGP